jgi:hypothetical protein
VSRWTLDDCERFTEVLSLPSSVAFALSLGKTDTENLCRTWTPNYGGARAIPENARKHASVPILAACEVAGVGALDWTNQNQNDKRFVDDDDKLSSKQCEDCYHVQ